MSEEQHLISAIEASPDDDTPRLVYADWLDEHERWMECHGCKGKGRRHLHAAGTRGTDGDCWECSGTGRLSTGLAERAEFIRLQCEMSRRGLHSQTANTSSKPTHRCTVCGALWVEYPESWSLCELTCRQCCDNVAMGEQIARLTEEESAMIARDMELRFAHGRKWVEPLAELLGAMVSSWSPHSPDPYLVLGGGGNRSIEFHRGFPRLIPG